MSTQQCPRCGQLREFFYAVANGRMRHCACCQRLAARQSYWRRRYAELERRARRRAAAYGCYIETVDYAGLATMAESCELCGRAIEPGQPLEFHHIRPLAQGGPHAAANVAVVHRYCNRAESWRVFILARLFNGA